MKIIKKTTYFHGYTAHNRERYPEAFNFFLIQVLFIYTDEMRQIHGPKPYFSSLKSKLSDSVWQWGIATYFIENIPFEFSTSQLLASQIAEYYTKTIVQNTQKPHTHLYEFGAGMGMLAKHVAEAIGQKKKVTDPSFTLHVSEYSQAQIDDINRHGFLSKLSSCTDFKLINALHPQFEDNATPDLIYLSYLVDALPTRQIKVKDGVIFERKFSTFIPEDAHIINQTAWPPQVLHADDIITLITQNDTEVLHKLTFQLNAIITETDHFIPMTESDDWLPDEKTLLTQFCDAYVPKTGEYRFNYPYQWLTAMIKMTDALASNGQILIHDFGFSQMESITDWNQLFGEFGNSRYASVCFPLLKWVANTHGAHVSLTPEPEGKSQIMTIYKSECPSEVDAVFKQIWAKASLYPVSHTIIEKLWSQDGDTPIEVTPEIVKNWMAGFPEIEKKGYSINAHLASALYQHGHYDEAILYAQDALKEYAPVGISALMVIGNAYIKKSDIPKAKQYFQQVLEISPHFPSAQYELSKIALIQSDMHAYITHMRSVIQHNPGPFSFSLLAKVATAYYQIADYPMALALADSLIKTYNDHPLIISEKIYATAMDIKNAVQEFKSVDAKTNSHLLTPITTHIIDLWKTLQGADSIIQMMADRTKSLESGEYQGIILLHKNTPVGIAWLEPVGLHYGNIVLHVLHDDYEPHIVKAALKMGMFDNKWLHELIKFKEHTQYPKLLEYFGLSKCTRYRMALYMDQYTPVPLPEDPLLVFTPTTQAHLSILSEIAYLAHQESHDQDLAYDMATREGRIELDKAFLDKLFGDPILEASHMVFYDGEPVGYYSVVEVKCWGYDTVPWIFDIGVIPKYHGKGLGKIMMAHMLNIIKANPKFTVIGLAVTNTNVGAIHIYEQFGFQMCGEFDEFGYPL